MGGNFKPMKHYGRDGGNKWLKYKGRFYYFDIFANVIAVDVCLRQLVQRQERLQIKLSRLDKEEKSSVQKLRAEIKTLPRQILLQEYTLYEKEGAIPNGPSRKMYDSLRQNPRWYCRPELVEDCITRGGCCSRGCGCCESRHFRPSSRGVGHCTLECNCCSDYRGFETTSEEKEEISKQLENMLESDSPAHLVRMTEAYFSKPKGGTETASLKRLWHKITR